MGGIEFSQSSGMRVVFIEEFAERGVNAIVEEARRVVGASLMFDILCLVADSLSARKD